MSRAHPSKLNAQISEEAAEWFIDFRTTDPDAASRAQFDTWVRSSPEHLRAYLEIAAIWNESRGLETPAVTDWMSELAATSNVIEWPVGMASSAVIDKQPSRRLAVAALLKAVLIGVGVSLGYRTLRPPIYSTDTGEQRSVRLDDGSIVELNSRARIRVRFSEDQRRVELLSGQALFQVAKSPTRPFFVHSDTTLIKAVGTQFDVDRKPGATVVTVIEGRVAVTTPSRPTHSSSALLLVAGEQATLTPSSVTQPVHANVAAVTAWTQNQLVFESARLMEVAEEFNRYSDKRLVVVDKGRPELLLSGVFSTDPNFFVRYLRARADVSVRETETEIRITRHD
jgi:transmembrane sensor